MRTAGDGVLALGLGVRAVMATGLAIRTPCGTGLGVLAAWGLGVLAARGLGVQAASDSSLDSWSAALLFIVLVLRGGLTMSQVPMNSPQGETFDLGTPGRRWPLLFAMG